ncbi:MAG TPA: PGPGW domain-containing protein [Ignavibacteriaceae bacterium]|jgi:tellurite resistance protein TerC|nr:PGPGW domain-containing protein [Ignavibacteriales bacterium]
MRNIIIKTQKQAKRLIIIVVGFTVLLLGVAMILLPGPAFIMIPLGLGILATEFVWARTLLNKFKEKLGRITKTNFTDKTK